MAGKSQCMRSKLIAGGLLLSSFLSVAEAKNVVFFIVDDLRPRLGAYGDPVAVTPAIDSLAKEGSLFNRAYCQYPICNPSRTSFLSGLRPDSTAVYGNDQKPEVALRGVPVLNQYFASNGFEVLGFGKIYHSGIGPDGGWSRPYTESQWLDYVRPENKAIGDQWFSPRRPKEQRVPASWEAEAVADDAYADGMMAREAVKSLKELAAQKKPFLMVFGFRHPHLPWCAPKKYWDLYDRESLPLATNRQFPVEAPKVATNDFGELWSYADIPAGRPLTEALERQSLHGYYAGVSYADAQVGKVISALKELNLFDDTVIVLVADNGYQMGDNGVWCKGVNWEATNRVPCLLRVPGLGQSGQTINRLVELVDIYPTVCAAAGLPIPGHCEGKSLLPLVGNPKAPWTDIAFTQLQRGKVMGRSIRTDRFRFTLWEQEDGTLVGCELYDQQNDPQGNVNLAGHPDWQDQVRELTSLHRKQWPAGRKHSQTGPE